jgi:hypothetical protein
VICFVVFEITWWFVKSLNQQHSAKQSILFHTWWYIIRLAKGRYLASMNFFVMQMKCPEFRTSYRRASSVSKFSLDCLKVIRWNPQKLELVGFTESTTWKPSNFKLIARWPTFPERSYACSCPGSRELPSFSPGPPKEIGLVLMGDVTWKFKPIEICSKSYLIGSDWDFKLRVSATGNWIYNEPIVGIPGWCACIKIITSSTFLWMHDVRLLNVYDSGDLCIWSRRWFVTMHG